LRWRVEKTAAASGHSIPSVSKSKRRGRGDTWVLIHEGKGGGTSGASFPLPLSIGGRQTVERGAAVRWGVVATASVNGGGR
jgi:hypothetical protein